MDKENDVPADYQERDNTKAESPRPDITLKLMRKWSRSKVFSRMAGLKSREGTPPSRERTPPSRERTPPSRERTPPTSRKSDPSTPRSGFRSKLPRAATGRTARRSGSTPKVRRPGTPETPHPVKSRIVRSPNSPSTPHPVKSRSKANRGKGAPLKDVTNEIRELTYDDIKKRIAEKRYFPPGYIAYHPREEENMPSPAASHTRRVTFAEHPILIPAPVYDDDDDEDDDKGEVVGRQDSTYEHIFVERTPEEMSFLRRFKRAPRGPTALIPTTHPMDVIDDIKCAGKYAYRQMTPAGRMPKKASSPVDNGGVPFDSPADGCSRSARRARSSGRRSRSTGWTLNRANGRSISAMAVSEQRCRLYRGDGLVCCRRENDLISEESHENICEGKGHAHCCCDTSNP